LRVNRRRKEKQGSSGGRILACLSTPGGRKRGGRIRKGRGGANREGH
jgi:hypothetical protein